TVSVTACSVEQPPSPSPRYGAMVFRPREGLSPTRPQQEAGARMDPKPSEPCAMGSMRAPTEAAAPPEDLPEMRAVSHGLLVGPRGPGVAGAVSRVGALAGALAERARTTLAALRALGEAEVVVLLEVGEAPHGHTLRSAGATF